MTAQDNLEVLRALEDASETDVSRMQLAIERVSEFFGSPAYFAFVAAFAMVWIGVNAWGFHSGWRYVDAPPFFWLQGLFSFNALILTIAVLIRQNRMSILAAHRAHLDLQINLATEQKVSRIFQLVQQMTPGAAPHLEGGDPEAEDLATPTDPKAMLEAIQQASDEK